MKIQSQQSQTVNSNHNHYKAKTERELIGILLQHPRLGIVIHKQYDALRSTHFDEADAKIIFGVIGELVAKKQPVSREAVEAELNNWADDPLTSDADAVRRAIDALPKLEAACPLNVNESNASKIALSFAQAIKAKHFENLPPLTEAASEPYTSTPGVPPRFESLPCPLVAPLRDVPELPAALIPAPLRDWLADIAERIACPLEFAAIPALIALASLVGRKVGIKPKRHDDWLVVGNLWGAIVGLPSALKTPAAEEALRPLKRLVTQARARYEEAVVLRNKELELYEIKRKAAKAKMKKCADKGANDEELEALQCSEEEPSEPVERRYIVNDATVPALGVRLKENPNGLLLYRDELLGWLKSLDQEQNECDRPFYLQAWNGTEENYVYDRIGRGTLFIPHVCVSVFGTIQPGPLAQYVRAAVGGAQADGLLQRFQLLVYPDAVKWRNVDRWPDTAAKNRAFAIFEKLDAMENADFGAEREEGRSIPFLRFAPDAQALFDEWRERLEIEKLQNTKDSAAMLSHLAKYRSLMPSLALLFHVIEVADGGKVGPVSLQATERAAAWCDYLEEHARRIYLLGEEANTVSAQTIADRLADLPNPFTAYDIARKGWRGLKYNDDILCALAILEDRNWIVGVDVHAPAGANGGRSTRKYFINPAALEGGEGK